ncbi:MAG: hypothetical protein IKF82_05030 [Bacilli bacterium]|nr:hypothetical protein [Bacilli bacterium]
MSFNEELGRLRIITICIYLFLLVIFTLLAIFYDAIFLKMLLIVFLVISTTHVRDYCAIYEKYYKQEYSLFKIYLTVSSIPTILVAMYCEVLLRVCFNLSLIA